jgi:PAS domain S-box-containing protein
MGKLMKFSEFAPRRQERDAARDAQERFPSPPEAIEDLVFINFDPEGQIVSWSAGAEHLFGYSEREAVAEPLGLSFISDGQDEAESQTDLHRALADGPAEDYRWMMCRDGSRLWARWVTTPMRDMSGNLLGFAKVLKDETKRKQAEDLFEKSLQEKDVLLQEFHHRVRNNFQVMSSLLSLQASESPDRQIQRLVDGLQGRIRSIAALHETLYGSRDSGNIDFRPYIARIGRDLIGSYGIDEERIQLCMNIDDTILRTEQALPLGLIVNELVSNALKHAFPGQRRGRIDVQFRHLREDIPERIPNHHWCELSVCDDGTGIRDADELWERQSMGLKIVHLLAGQLHGCVYLDQSDSTHFTVRFPQGKGRFPRPELLMKIAR